MFIAFDELREGMTCKVCLANVADMLFLPCGHLGKTTLNQI